MFTPPNGMWVCATDKYLQPAGKVIDQIYDGQRKNSWWDFMKFILSVYFQATSLCLRCAGGDDHSNCPHKAQAAALICSLHATT